MIPRDYDFPPKINIEDKEPTALKDAFQNDKYLEAEAWKSWEKENKHHPTGINPYAYTYGYKVAKLSHSVKAEPTAFQWSDELKEEYMLHLEKLLYKTGARFTRKGWIEKKLSQSIPAGTGTANETINEEGIGAKKNIMESPYVIGVDPYKTDSKVQFTEKRLLEEKKDWEIVKSHATHGVDGWPIIIDSVKRLSDNEVFSVGDKVKWAHHPEFKIQSFRSGIPDTMMFAVDMKDLSYDIREIKRPKPTANDVSSGYDLRKIWEECAEREKRIEVTQISSTHIDDYDSKEAWIKATLSHHPDANKMRAVRKAIEQVLNQ